MGHHRKSLFAPLVHCHLPDPSQEVKGFQIGRCGEAGHGIASSSWLLCENCLAKGVIGRYRRRVPVHQLFSPNFSMSYDNHSCVCGGYGHGWPWRPTYVVSVLSVSVPPAPTNPSSDVGEAHRSTRFTPWSARQRHSPLYIPSCATFQAPGSALALTRLIRLRSLLPYTVSAPPTPREAVVH